MYSSKGGVKCLIKQQRLVSVTNDCLMTSLRRKEELKLNVKELNVNKRKRRCIFKRITNYYEWKKPGSKKDDKTIPIEYHSPEGRYMTPTWDRVFPSGYDLTEIDVERYILLVRNWGRRQYKALKELEDSYKCGFGCGELGYPEVYMGNGALYCGECREEK